MGTGEWSIVRGQLIDLKGQRFHRLVATNQVKRTKLTTRRLCYCDCGNEVWIPTHRIMTGHTKSCGCFRREVKMLEPGKAVRNLIFDQYQRDAKKRNLEWRLTGDQFDDLIAQSCYYCKRPPSMTRKARRCNGDLTYNGIDRINNNLGYTTNNVAACCQICNRAKSNMTLEDFESWIKDLSEAYNDK